MEEGGLLLKANDERRVEVLIRVEAGLLTVAGAAVLGVSERQARRLVAAYRSEGSRRAHRGRVLVSRDDR